MSAIITTGSGMCRYEYAIQKCWYIYFLVLFDIFVVVSPR